MPISVADTHDTPPAPPEPSSLTILRAGAEDAAAALARRQWAADVRLIKRDGEAATWIGTLNMARGGRRVVLKRMPRRAGLAGALQRLLGHTRANRQIRGARLLANAGVAVSTPIALHREPAADWLLLDESPGVDLIQLLARPSLSFADEAALARQSGALVRHLARAGIVNRDHKLSNLVRSEEGDLAVIDTVGVRRRRLLEIDPAERMLAAMLFEAVGAGVLPRRAALWRCLAAAVDDPQDSWDRLTVALAAHGDPTPRIDPRRLS